MFRLLLAATAAASMPAHAAVAPAPKAPRAETLANGLRVIVLEDHSAPIVAVQVTYHVGSRNEVPGQRGIAHLFEHLMFEGTQNTAVNELTARIEAVGGSDNAYTTEDSTGYHEVVPRERLDLVLWLEADRMRGLKLDAKVLASEREVVQEERRLRMENDPIGKAFESFLGLAYTEHPYAWSPAGKPEDLAAITVPDLQAFYDRWYQPGNAVLVIVGDVDADDALALTRTRFGSIPAGNIVRPGIPPEPVQTEIRRRTLVADTQLPTIIGGYKVPERAHPDMPAIEVLGQILSSGDSSRLHRALVRDLQLAVFVEASPSLSEDPGLFSVYVASLPEVAPERVEAALLAELDRIAAGGVTARELEKAKNQLAAEHVFGLDSVEAKAEALSDAEVLEGGYQRFLDGPKRYLDVRPSDVEAVARKYLVKERLTLLTLLPTPGAEDEDDDSGDGDEEEDR